MDMIWKPVVGYEGVYEVSSLGAVRSLDRHVTCKGGVRIARGKNLKPMLNGKGYLHVGLSAGTTKTTVIHKIVAEAFHGIRPPGAIINHKDGVKANNRASNLEWCTHTYNNVHALSTGLRVIPKGKDHPLFGRVGARKGMKANPASVEKMRRSKTGVPIPRVKVTHVATGVEYQSIAAAARALGVKASTLRAQVRGQNKNALGVTLL